MLAYRKDIDGLRAIAVLLVIFYHLGFSFIPGGFIGVDIFFVLSGFLITSIINKKIITNSFTFSDFYLKRIRRIYPLLLFVMLITSIVGYFILLPNDYYQLSKSAGLAFISLSNFYFKNISSGYFGSSTEIMPLLHTWSLAVEEQFYLIWPIALILLYKASNNKNIPKLILFSTLGFLVLSQYLALKNSSSSYFLIPARTFELLSGATLALYWNRLPTLNSTLQHALSIISLSTLIAVSLLLDKASVFPGINAAIVCLATCVFIYTGKQNAITNRLLSLKPLVYIGAISYSLYLWHWPLIAYTNYLSIEKSLDIQLYLLLLTFLLSIVSYHLIENTFRFRTVFTFKKTAFIFLGIPFLLLSTFILINKETDGLPSRYSANEQDMLKAVESGYYTPCKSDVCDDTFKNNLTGNLSDSDFLLIGDSHASALRGMINYFANESNKTGYFYSHSGSPLLFNAYVFDQDENKTLNNDITNNIIKYKQVIDNFKGNTVIISNRYSFYLHGRNEISTGFDVLISTTKQPPTDLKMSQKNYSNLFLSSIEYILSKGKKVILVTQIPELGSDLSRCSVINSHTNSAKTCFIQKDSVELRNQEINNLFKTIDSPNVSLINIQDITCDSNTCKTIIDGVPIYQDDDHLNYLGAKMLGKVYLDSHQNPLN